MSDGGTAARRENPRTRRLRELVLADGIELLVSDGGEAVTAVRIAERTGVARSAIYRHWPNRAALLLAVVDRAVAPHHSTELSGDLAHDLRTALSNLRLRMRLRPFTRVFATLLAEANRDDTFVAPQRRLVDGVVSPLREVLLDGRGRGELPDTLDLDSACAQLAGPLLHQHVMLRAPIEDGLVDRLLGDFLGTHRRTPHAAEGEPSGD